jgi:hypothetical protein
MENNMATEEDRATSETSRRTTSADFSFQFSAARKHQKVLIVSLLIIKWIFKEGPVK